MRAKVERQTLQSKLLQGWFCIEGLRGDAKLAYTVAGEPVCFA